MEQNLSFDYIAFCERRATKTYYCDMFYEIFDDCVQIIDETTDKIIEEISFDKSPREFAEIFLKVYGWSDSYIKKVLKEENL